MPLFYTRKGDDGRSRIGKKTIYKLNPFVIALGELDELNSMIGILKADRINSELKRNLHNIQENLFIIQANLAYAMLKEKRKPPLFTASKTAEVEKIIDTIEKKLKPSRGFVISGSTSISAWLDMLRARSRKVERSVLGIRNFSERVPRKAGSLWKLEISDNILPYLNRLSSLFFALARWEARHKKEQNPKYK